MASQPARSRRSRTTTTKLTDALKTAEASLEPENRLQTPARKRSRRDTDATLPGDPNKRIKVEARPVFEAPARRAEGGAPAPKTPAPKTPANKPAKTYTRRRSRSASANPTPGPSGEKAKTVSQNKVANGIRHELERLGVPVTPAGGDTPGTKDEKRKLRSEGRARFKSELALYFPEYDVVMKNEEEESNILDADTPILIIDSAPSMPKPRGRHSISPSKKRTTKNITTGVPGQRSFKEFSSDIFTNLYQAQKVDLSCLDGMGRNIKTDPLPDDLYRRPHLREERAEKGIKNLENMNSLHGRNHIAQLLEGLEGTEWLKVLGVGGVITETKKVEFEYAQQYFVKRCKEYLKKCREWKEIEKRREVEKKRKAQELEEDSGDDSDGDPPDYSDVDHAAAMQLHDEAVKRSAPHQVGRKRQRVGFVEPPPQPEKEITSFFAKPHLREAALSKRRRSGRGGVLAFGQPIPDGAMQEFELPEDIKELALKNASPKRMTRTRRSSILESIVSRMTMPN